jgi:hypothetical protein
LVVFLSEVSMLQTSCSIDEATDRVRRIQTLTVCLPFTCAVSSLFRCWQPDTVGAEWVAALVHCW